MQAMKVYRPADGPGSARRYLDGKRVSRATWDAAHAGRRTDAYASHMLARPNGSTIVREYHHIRTRN
jgi:hypothetical protein